MNPELTLLDDGSLKLCYHLHELPTAQHKAGLAGLLFLSRNMQSRGLDGHIEITALAADSAEIVVSLDTLKATFDDLYAASWRELYSRSKFAGREPKRTEEVPVEDDATGKTEKRYVYDEFRPDGGFFAYLLEGGTESPWLKLWQDMLWAVLRAQPAARSDYETRANGAQLMLADKQWEALLKAAKGRSKNRLSVDSVAGSLFIGAQASNAEKVSFQGPVELNLLLHFWQLVAPLFAPRTIDVKNHRMADQGYLLAIPEVSDLAEFLEDIERFWKKSTAKRNGYRPEQAVIDLPQEGGLEFLYDLAHLRAAQGIGLSVSGVEWFHQEKQGNNVRMHGYGRIRADRGLLKRYEEARARHGNPLFKQLTLGNLLAGRPWHQGAAGLCALHPAEFFIHTAKTPRFAFFGAAARRRFNAILKDPKAQENPAMNEKKTDAVDNALVARVYQLIGAYVEHRVHERTRMRRRDFAKDANGHAHYPKELREAVEKVAKDAFLAMRGRNDREFIAYFTGTICSVPQFFGRQEDFITLSQALIADPELIKDLSMLALSAHSWMPYGDDATDAQANP
ncbi:MAG: type I-MYXAN CRISPR-associated protein Cmx8 [Methylococcaceae bacterium]|nr:MAG: type I-MYXAN CRISPR-associated protein Cmx8 [Methylococcaceae bacterium]